MFLPSQLSANHLALISQSKNEEVILEAAAKSSPFIPFSSTHFSPPALIPTYFLADCDVRRYDRYQSRVPCLNMTIRNVYDSSQ